MSGALPWHVERLLIPLANVVLALAATGAMLWWLGVSPRAALAGLIGGAFGSADGIAYTLYYATTYICAGLAVAIPYQAGLFNIGGEGQAMLGGLGATLVCLGCGGTAPGWLVVPAAMLAAMAMGAAWALIPALLQVGRGSSVVVTTIMFNFIAAALMTWLLSDTLRAVGDVAPETRGFDPATFLPAIAGSPLSLCFPLALLLAAAAWWFLRRTVAGYELRVIGLGPEAARYAAIPVGRVLVGAMLLGGAAAGLIGVNETMGVLHRLVLGFTAGSGFVGIAVALIGRADPLGVVVAALLFGALAQGGSELSFDYPQVTRDIVTIVNGLVVLGCGAFEGVLRRPARRWHRRVATEGGAPP